MNETTGDHCFQIYIYIYIYIILLLTVSRLRHQNDLVAKRPIKQEGHVQSPFAD